MKLRGRSSRTDLPFCVPLWPRLLAILSNRADPDQHVLLHIYTNRLQLTIRNITRTSTGEANLSVSFTARAGLRHRWIPPKEAQGAVTMPPKVVEVGWEGLFSPTYTSKKLTPLQSQVSSDTAWLIRMELNTTLVSGACTTARFAVLSVLRQKATSTWGMLDNPFSYQASPWAAEGQSTD